MRPGAQADRHDSPWLLDEVVPGIAAVIEQVVVAEEDAIGEPVLADELPDAFLRVGGSGMRLMLAGTTSFGVMCHPAWSSSSTACLAGSTLAEMAASCRLIASVLHQGRTRPTALPCAGQMAPKIYVDAVR